MFSNKDTVLESVEFSTAAVGCDISAFGRANYDKAFYDIRKKDGIFIRNTYDAEGLRAELEENGKLVRFLSSIREKSAESGTLERMCSADSPEAAVGSGNNAAEPLYEQLMRDRGIPSTLTPEEKALNRALDLRMQYEGGIGTKGYSVDPTMFADDEATGVLINGEYIKNPTAHNINDYISEGSNYLGNKNMNGQYMYVIDADGNIIIGTRGGQRMPHATLIGGYNPQVQAAGILEIRGGKIYSINNASGHFKPSNECLSIVEEIFSKLPQKIFSKDFLGYLPYGQ